MNKYYFIFFIPLFSFIFCSSSGHPDNEKCNSESMAKKVEDLKNMDELPYYPEMSGDKEFWEVVKCGLDIVELLINKLDDTTSTIVNANLIGYTCNIADISFIALNEIIHVPINKLMKYDYEGKDEGCGFCVYWYFVRGGGIDGRANYARYKELKKYIKEWYDKNKDDLIWVEDNMNYKTSEDWPYESNRHPAGGYYILKK